MRSASGFTASPVSSGSQKSARSAPSESKKLRAVASCCAFRLTEVWPDARGSTLFALSPFPCPPCTPSPHLSCNKLKSNKIICHAEGPAWTLARQDAAVVLHSWSKRKGRAQSVQSPSQRVAQGGRGQGRIPRQRQAGIGICKLLRQRIDSTLAARIFFRYSGHSSPPCNTVSPRFDSVAGEEREHRQRNAK